MQKPTLIKSLARSQIAAVIATAGDFAALIFLTEVAGIYYVSSAGIGAFIGAAISFLLGRFWAFVAPEGNLIHQIIKYGLVSGGSIVLNSAGVYLITDFWHVPYPVSKIITAVLVGLTYNFFLHRYFVFRQ